MSSILTARANFHSQTETYSGRRKKSKIKEEKNKNKFCICGKRIQNNSKKCVDCNKLKSRKVERPSYEQLTNDVKSLGYCGTGRKYGVSDNSIRKWIKNYN